MVLGFQQSQSSIELLLVCARITAAPPLKQASSQNRHMWGLELLL